MDLFWSIKRVTNEGTVEWCLRTGANGYVEWSSQWTKRERFGIRGAAMSKLWEIRVRSGDRISLVKVTRKSAKSD